EMASASMTTGTDVAKISSSSANAASSVPRPGPTTHASTRRAEATSRAGTTSGNSVISPSVITMDEVVCSAPAVHMMPAPGNCSLPAAIPVTPWVYLLSKIPGNNLGSGPVVARWWTSSGTGCAHTSVVRLGSKLV